MSKWLRILSQVMMWQLTAYSWGEQRGPINHRDGLIITPQRGVTHHDICLSLGVTQVWIQPEHQLFHLLPVEEDDENQEEEVEDAQT